MKKLWLTVLIASLVAVLAACGGDKADDAKDKDDQDETKLVVGASPNPHEELLEFVKPQLEEQGIDLEIETYTEFAMANKDLASGDLDANFYQHIQFFENQKKEYGYDFANAGEIHMEPIGIYSKRHKTLDDLPEGATILLSSSVSDHGRMLALLEEKGLITLKDGVNKSEATLEDIEDNPKNFEFDDSTSPEMLVQMYENDEGDAVLINSNFALDHDINPREEAIALENEDSPYVNIVAVRTEDENNKAVKALVEALRSDETKEFMLEQWNGSVVPAK